MVVRFYRLQFVLNLKIGAELRPSLLEKTVDDLVLLPVPVQLDEVVEVHAAGGVLAGLVDGRRHNHFLRRFGRLELLH